MDIVGQQETDEGQQHGHQQQKGERRGRGTAFHLLHVERPLSVEIRALVPGGGRDRVRRADEDLGVLGGDVLVDVVGETMCRAGGFLALFASLSSS